MHYEIAFLREVTLKAVFDFGPKMVLLKAAWLSSSATPVLNKDFAQLCFIFHQKTTKGKAYLLHGNEKYVFGAPEQIISEVFKW